MNELRWMNWNERIEIKELRWMNWNERIEIKDLKLDDGWPESAEEHVTLVLL